MFDKQKERRILASIDAALSAGIPDKREAIRAEAARTPYNAPRPARRVYLGWAAAACTAVLALVLLYTSFMPNGIFTPNSIFGPGTDKSLNTDVPAAYTDNSAENSKDWNTIAPVFTDTRTGDNVNPSSATASGFYGLKDLPANWVKYKTQQASGQYRTYYADATGDKYLIITFDPSAINLTGYDGQIGTGTDAKGAEYSSYTPALRLAEIDKQVIATGKAYISAEHEYKITEGALSIIILESQGSYEKSRLNKADYSLDTILQTPLYALDNMGIK